MKVQQNISLKSFNTFGIDVLAKEFAVFSSADELTELLTTNNKQQASTLILGGGSNILLIKDYDGLVLKNEIKGIELINENEHHIDIRVGAGENWHEFVLHCIQHDWAGVENLSLIPGNIGASPMQNIGAYGVEIKDVFYSLEAYNYNDKKVYTFTLNDCEFGYRESVFKRKYKNQFVILNVTYRLNKQPKFNTTYGAIEQELEKMGVQELSIQAISQAVINIRSSKLPDPKVIGNAGSFFKNPSVTKEQYESIKLKYPNVVGYANADGSIKLAAGWLIEQCGWKGYRKGDAGCHARQALVIVNYGNAKGSDIYNLSEEILQSVKEKFNVTLEREVNII
ncbi:MAG: UDP-N-acetylmuramate dehydrogenase [Sphingobacteriales bacterium]|nr:MAG: UDP-N-acetylmuramate dehydrogenase [Sphingobacteriales bacterium]